MPVVPVALGFPLVVHPVELQELYPASPLVLVRDEYSPFSYKFKRKPEHDIMVKHPDASK